MDGPVIDILRRQIASGLPDFAGAHATATIPLPDRLLNDLIAASIPPSAAITSATIETHPADHFTLHVRPARPSFMPTLTLNLHIESQPVLPASPVLVLRLDTAGVLMNIAGPALNSMKILPSGIHLERDRIHVNIGTLLDERHLGDLLRFVEDLQVTTAEGAIVLMVKARVGAR